MSSDNIGNSATNEAPRSPNMVRLSNQRIVISSLAQRRRLQDIKIAKLENELTDVEHRENMAKRRIRSLRRKLEGSALIKSQRVVMEDQADQIRDLKHQVLVMEQTLRDEQTEWCEPPLTLDLVDMTRPVQWGNEEKGKPTRTNKATVHVIECDDEAVTVLRSAPSGGEAGRVSRRAEVDEGAAAAECEPQKRKAPLAMEAAAPAPAHASKHQKRTRRSKRGIN